MQVLGLWGEKPRPIYRYFLALFTEGAFLFVPKMMFGPGEEGFDSFVCNLAELIFVGEVVVSFGLFNCRARSFAKLVHNLQDVVERYGMKPNASGIRTTIENTEKFCRIYAIYVWIAVTFYTGFPLLSSLASLRLKPEDERGDFMPIMVMKFYSLDVRRNITDYGIYFVLVFLASTCSATQSMLKVTVISTIIKYGGVMFDFTTLKIKHLAEFPEGDERRQELREIIELHQLALEYAAHLEKSVSFFLLNQMSCCVLLMCLMMYYISTAAKVGNTMYAYAWYSEPVDMQKDIQFIIARSQRPTGITAAKFYFVNRERFAIVSQTSLSYYLFLKNTF
ncbi:uncharacterized protein LOC128739411 [Sabethes cyaneus]|uniref:uncharacterized protein LOC128739411 n=1 Tax=Sabethes cyaneus TaxID=53552 RepID=UPI00237DCB58|nr:uncharacterized protein LOC128739411 [Sabethes cyaneus]